MQIFLYQINHSANIGMIIRSAIGFNISRLYFFDPKGIFKKKIKPIKKISQGTFEKMEIITINDPIKFLKDYNGRKVITCCKEGISLNNFKPKSSDLVIFGNERGLPKEILDFSDIKLNIPLTNNLNSLNLACAFSIIAYKYSY